MWMSLRASTSRLAACIPAQNAVRQISTSSPLRIALQGKKALSPRDNVQTPSALLDLMGRDAPKNLGERANTWEELTDVYRQGTAPMRDAGVSVKDRKYYMHCLHRFSEGDAPQDFVRPPRGPKKFRGLGPKIQFGVRVFLTDGTKVKRTGPPRNPRRRRQQ